MGYGSPAVQDQLAQCRHTGRKELKAIFLFDAIFFSLPDLLQP